MIPILYICTKNKNDQKKQKQMNATTNLESLDILYSQIEYLWKLVQNCTFSKMKMAHKG